MAKKLQFSIGVFVSVLLVFLFSFLNNNIAEASPSVLRVIPTSGQYTVGSSFNAEIIIDTGEAGASALEVKVNYDPSVLEYSAIDYEGSPFDLALGDPEISPGDIMVGRAIYQEGGFKGTGRVATITFKALKVVDSTSVTIDKESSEVAEYGTGENLLTSVQDGAYSVNPSILSAWLIIAIIIIIVAVILIIGYLVASAKKKGFQRASS